MDRATRTRAKQHASAFIDAAQDLLRTTSVDRQPVDSVVATVTMEDGSEYTLRAERDIILSGE